MWWKRNKWKVIVPLIFAVVLLAAFFLGDAEFGSKDGGPAQQTGSSVSDSVSEEEAVPEEMPSAEEGAEVPADSADAQTEEGRWEPSPEQPAGNNGAAAPPTQEDTQQQGGMEIDPETGKDQYQTDPVPEGKPLPVEPQNAAVSTTARTCTISVSCQTLAENIQRLDESKRELVPENGWLLAPVSVTFYEGESVFNVLQRTCKQFKIHLEFVNTPIYNSAYIEGIGNLYEFDGGSLSGWMYKVNGWFPNYGCSRYQLRDGDTVCFVYTCDLGRDVGGEYSTENTQKDD